MQPPADTSWIQMDDGRTPCMSRLPRWTHRWWACQLGYWWLPCPLCDQPFGGHEWRDIGGKTSEIPDPVRSWTKLGICPACTRSGRGTASQLWTRDGMNIAVNRTRDRKE